MCGIPNILSSKMLLQGFLSIVGDIINERAIRKFEEGLNSKVKLLLYNYIKHLTRW